MNQSPFSHSSYPPVPSYYQQSNNDEIDLRELFSVLWQGKRTILLCTVLFAVAAVIYALTAQQWWSAKATVTQPELSQIVTFQQQVKQYQPLFDLYQEDGTIVVSEELNELINPTTIFQRFVRAFNANDNKKRFMQTNPTFLAIKQQQLKTYENNETDDAQASFYQEWYGKITAQKVGEKQADDFHLSFQSVDKASSLMLLNAYIDFINQQLNQQLTNDLDSKLTVKHNQLSQQYWSLQQQTQLRLQVELARVQNALVIAKAANISEPVQNLNEEKLFAISIGSKALQAKVVALKSITNLSVFEPSLALLQAQIQQVELLGKVKPAQVQGYAYLEQPEAPISRDKPKRALIAVLGTLLGGMLGVAIVLVRFAFRKKEERA
ncbi:Wzz/FepE/Etk N-terminal domain-containing protein [Vibrio sp. 2-2(8)]|uniref:Wzz/FepE/Etk N-terminal domain-containing protein n=1 Tax=Vibrio sp. 2-2(8) TaxID=2591014 RepID=UPI001483C2C3|nr:LPS chain length-determining protein [Vibrio sp. 2-2(8)]